METYDEDFEEYIDCLESRLKELDNERQTVEKDLVEARRVYERFSKYKHNGSISPHPVFINEELRRKFEGLSVRQCLEIIAQGHGNLLEVSKARAILHEAGIVPKNISADIARATDVFKKTDKRGVYQYINPAETSDSPAKQEETEDGWFDAPF